MELKRGDLVLYREYPDFMDLDVWTEGIGIIMDTAMGDGTVGILAGDRVIPIFRDDISPL